MILLVLNWNHPQAAVSTIGTKVGSGIVYQFNGTGSITFKKIC